MISSILSSCANTGGSTTGSSSVGSATIPSGNQNQSLYVGNLIKSIILNTYQPVNELLVGLNYILENTRKKYANFYTSLL